MPHLPDNQLDDCIAYALQSEIQVTSAQKRRAWESLRQKVEARIAEQNAAPVTADALTLTSVTPEGCDTHTVIEGVDPDLHAEPVLEHEMEMLAVPELQTRTVQTHTVNEPGAFAFVLKQMVGAATLFMHTIDGSARFLFSDEFSLERARQCNPPMHRHHLLLMPGFSYAAA